MGGVSVTLSPENVAYCLGAFIDRDRLRAELAQAQAALAALSPRPEPEATRKRVARAKPS